MFCFQNGFLISTQLIFLCVSGAINYDSRLHISRIKFCHNAIKSCVNKMQESSSAFQKRGTLLRQTERIVKRATAITGVRER